MVVEIITPLHNNSFCYLPSSEMVSGQDLVFQYGEERLRGRVVKTRNKSNRRLGNLDLSAEFCEVTRGVGRPAVGVEHHSSDGVPATADRDCDLDRCGR